MNATSQVEADESGLPPRRFFESFDHDQAKDFQGFAENCERLADRMLTLIWGYSHVLDSSGRKFERTIEFTDMMIGIMDQMLRDLHEAAAVASEAARDAKYGAQVIPPVNRHAG